MIPFRAMTTLLRVLVLFIAASLSASAMPKAREEAIFVFENRKLTIAVPAGFECLATKDETGTMIVKLASAKEKVSGEVKFLPDPDNQFLSSRARKDLMNEMFFDYVESSTEKAMRFEELEPQVGGGTYCVFTDASLVGKTPLPPGQSLHLTAGLKAWPGVVAVFRVFSNDITSSEYQAVLKLIREGVQEKPVPLK